MKKAFDQTVREIKREVNKKVLKVPGIEQKVLDATSNEPWGPHGSLLADIAHSSRNYHEYQMIMAVIWKRISDTGKNWRHVYKALTVLEYLVAHGSERVIDEIREHAYQISALSNFQYIDSSGRDQGNNVRKKSQSLVILVNDKERIQEARQKAAANRDKYRNTSMGGMYRPSSYSGTGGYGDRFDDDRYEGRYGSREDDRHDYGREREWGYRDDDHYGRYADSYGRDVDQYNRDRDEQYGRDGFRDDDYRGRSQSIDDYQYNSRSRSSDREGDRTYDNDGQYSSRGRGGRADDHSQDGSFSGKQLDRKSSEQNIGAPPSYEEAVGEAHSPVQSERVGEIPSATIPKPFLPVSSSPSPAIPVPATSAAPSVASAPPSVASAPTKKEDDGFNEFDPRSSFPESFSSNTLAITLVTSASTTPEANASTNFSVGSTFAARPSPSFTNQPFEDPFGDGPFRAVPSTDTTPTQPQNVAPISSIHPSTDWSFETPQSVAQNADSTNLGAAFPGTTSTPSNNRNAELPPKNAQFLQQEFPTSNQITDILADILPPSGPSLPISQAGFPAQGGMTGIFTQADHAAQPTALVSQPASHSGFVTQTGQPQPQANFSSQPGHLILQNDLMDQARQPAPLTGFLNQNSQPGNVTAFPGQSSAPSETELLVSSAQPAQPVTNSYGNFIQQSGSSTLATSYMVSQTNGRTSMQYNNADFIQQANPTVPVPQQMAPLTPGSLAARPNNVDMLGNFLSQGQPTTSMTSQPAFHGSLATIPQPAKDKFELKSAVWADTLSRGLVNLNISGPKINPHSDIGIDFDALNRKEKRMEKPATATVTSTVTMGKAMGSGSGMGRLGAGALRPPPNLMVGSGIGMGMGGSPGVGMGMGGFGGLNQHSMGMGMGMGMAMNRPMNNTGVSQGVPMQPTGFPSGSNVPGGYNLMIGGGGYAPRPYGGGYQ